MPNAPRWRRYLRFWGANIDADVDDELAFHLDMRAREYEARGLPPDEARRAALERFGDVSHVGELLRDHDHRLERTHHRREHMSDLVQDLKLALRGLRRAPGFALVVIATLALCIGANSAIFSVVNAVLLQPLPFHEPEGLVRVYQVWEGKNTVMSPPNFLDVARQSHTLASAAAFTPGSASLTSGGDPVRVALTRTSATFFDVLAVPPLLGRGFKPEENEPARTHVVVIGHALWQQRFGASPSALGATIELDGERYTIVGVMPEGFTYPVQTEMWAPITYDAQFTTTARGAWYIGVVGRLRPSATVGAAATEIATIGKRLEAQYPADNLHVGMTARSLRDALVGDVRGPLLILLASVTFVLLIACANVANLLLARSASRRTEMAVRSALGAGRGRLVRQLLAESVLLSVIGGAIGLVLAMGGVKLLVALKPSGIPRLDTVHVDATVTAFTAALSVLTGIVFGLAPAAQLIKPSASLTSPLRAGSRGVVGGAGQRLRSALIVAEIAIALVLLTGAGLLMRSFVRLASVDPGFHPEQRLTIDVALPRVKYATDDARRGFYDRLTEDLASLPGMQSVSGSMGLPLGNTNFEFAFSVDGWPPVVPGNEPSMQTRVVMPGYFRTMGIPLVRGRAIATSDGANTPPVALVNQAAVRRFFPNADPIGKHVVMAWHHVSDKGTVNGTIVGIVGDVKESTLDRDVVPEIYFPYAQQPVSDMSMVVETSASTGAIAPAIRREVKSLDPTLPTAEVKPLEQRVSDAVSRPRFYVSLIGVFAAIALVLAAVGIGGMMSFAVAIRTREIGIRVALGASRGGVVGLVMREAMQLAVMGVVLGAVMAAALSRALASLLFGVGARDPATFAGAASLLIVVALGATLLPARRAAAVEPAIALRSD